MTAELILLPFDDPIPQSKPRKGKQHVGPPLAQLLASGEVGFKRPRIGVRFRYDAALVDALHRKVRGVWHPDRRMHSFPLTAENCRLLREVFGPGMIVEIPLRDWYREAMAVEQDRRNADVAKLEAAERERAAQVQLEAERALYGETASAGILPGQGVPGDADVPLPVGNPPARTPISECVPVSKIWIRPEPEGEARDWRADLQDDGAAWLSGNAGGVLADEVGLGKSRLCIMAALDGARALAGVHLIVAPLKPAGLTWPEELERWAPQARILEWPLGVSSGHAVALRHRAIDVARRAGSGGGFKSGPVFLVINHTALRAYPQLLDVAWASIIVDEAHEVLSRGNRGASSTQVAARLRDLATIDEIGMRVACTGTPFVGRLANLWGLLDFVTPGRHGDRRSFTAIYTTSAGEAGSGLTLDRVAPGCEAVWGRLMRDWVLRRTRTAAQRALVVDEVVAVEPTERQREQDDAWRRRRLWTGPHVETDDARPAHAGGPMISIDSGVVLPDVIQAVTRRIQLAAGEMDGIDDESILAGAPAVHTGPSGKVDYLEELLESWGLLDVEWWHLAGEHGKAIIASPWTSGLDLVETMLARRLPPGSWRRIDGSSGPKRMEEAKQAFCAERGPGLLLLSSTAGGAGLTLDQHCTRLVLFSEHWTADVQDQVIGRIANRTWETARQVVRLRSAGMLDAYIGARGAHQEHVQSAMLELAHA